MQIGHSFGVVQAIFNLTDRQNEVLPHGNKYAVQRHLRYERERKGTPTTFLENVRNVHMECITFDLDMI